MDVIWFVEKPHDEPLVTITIAFLSQKGVCRNSAEGNGGWIWGKIRGKFRPETG
jgi:hypothetical protein